MGYGRYMFHVYVVGIISRRMMKRLDQYNYMFELTVAISNFHEESFLKVRADSINLITHRDDI